MADLLPWITPVLAFLGAALGGVGAQLLSHKQRRQQAKEDRRRQRLIDLQRALHEHFLDGRDAYKDRGRRFFETGKWDPPITTLMETDLPRPTTYAAHLVTQLRDDELRQLVPDLLDAITEASVLASSLDEANKAMAHVLDLYGRVYARIEVLLSRLP